MSEDQETAQEPEQVTEEAVIQGAAEMTEEELQAIKHALERELGAFRSVNVVASERLTTGQRLADAVTKAMGSWRFIIIQSLILLVWLILNVIGWVQHWDPYPFILLNLGLSFQAAYAAPIIMMSQNRQAAKDRLNAEHDFQIDIRAELEVAAIKQRLDDLAGRQWDALVALQDQQLDLLGQIETLTREVHRVTTVRTPSAGSDDSRHP
jgi:uncharacterized membrane protein